MSRELCDMDLSTLNVERLQWIKKQILEEPRRFFMEGYAYLGQNTTAAPQGPIDCDDVDQYHDYDNDYGTGFCGCDRDDLPEDWVVPPCKTAGCIAGWANMHQNMETGLPLAVKVDSEDRAADWLGFSFKEGIDSRWHTFPIFHIYTWPVEYRARYVAATDSVARAQAAADFIDHLCALAAEVKCTQEA